MGDSEELERVRVILERKGEMGDLAPLIHIVFYSNINKSPIIFFLIHGSQRNCYEKECLK